MPVIPRKVTKVTKFMLVFCIYFYFIHNNIRIPTNRNHSFEKEVPLYSVGSNSYYLLSLWM